MKEKLDIAVWAVCSWYVLVPLALVAGRFFCRWVCPLGWCQTLVNLVFHPKTRMRRVCTRLPRPWYQRTVNCALVAVYFFAPLGYLLHPWGIFGRAVFAPAFTAGLILFAVVLVSAAFGGGRFWCNWVCPVGTVLDAVARFAWFRDRVGRGCANCRRCLRTDGGAAAESAAAKGEGVSRREAIAGGVALAGVSAVEAAVVEKFGDGGYAEVSAPGVIADRPGGDVLPPGAIDRRHLATHCIGCGYCVAACPNEAIRLSTSLRTFGQPYLDFTSGYCLEGCDFACGKACPKGALEKLPTLRRHVHMGHAIWKRDRCLRTTEGERCTACVRRCPVEAIKLVEGVPVVDKSVCIGCGACEHVCPVRPLPAIFVKGFEKQRIVLPMNEDELVAEMTKLVRGGNAVVTAQNGVIVAFEQGSGVVPILKLLDAGKLDGAVVVDKVAGRAVAAICAVAGVKRLHTLRLGEDAIADFERAGIRWSGEERVPRILDHTKTDCCPFEREVEGMTDPAAMVKAIREKLRTLPAGSADLD